MVHATSVRKNRFCGRDLHFRTEISWIWPLERLIWLLEKLFLKVFQCLTCFHQVILKIALPLHFLKCPKTSISATFWLFCDAGSHSEASPGPNRPPETVASLGRQAKPLISKTYRTKRHPNPGHQLLLEQLSCNFKLVDDVNLLRAHILAGSAGNAA